MQSVVRLCVIEHLLLIFLCFTISRLQLLCCTRRCVLEGCEFCQIGDNNYHMVHSQFDLLPVPKFQESCLYPRLNAALRNHDNRSLEPFLPYMKLLLSGLYQLPLVQVPTYRGVKLQLFEVSDDAVLLILQENIC